MPQRNKEEKAAYMKEYRAKKRLELSKITVVPCNNNNGSQITFNEIDESAVQENLLMILNNPTCSISDRIRALVLAKDLLKEKDSIERKPRPLLPPAEADVHGFTS